MSVYFSKKRKKEMLIRKKKKKRNESYHLNEGEESSLPPISNTNSSSLDSKNSTESIESNSIPVHKKEKEEHQEEIIINGKLMVRFPSGLSVAQKKKFRKEFRRKLRKRNQTSTKIADDDQEIEFLEQNDPLPEPLLAPPLPPHSSSSSSTPSLKKSKKKSFPRINDLLAAEQKSKQIEKERQKQQKNHSNLSNEEKSNYVALDCEMVGIGSGGKQSALARVSLVDFDGEILLDTHVRVVEKITDFRTHVSGIRAKDLKQQRATVMELHECRMKVGRLLLNRILVGHALHNDLKVLMMDHPKKDRRDTARYPDFMKVLGKNGGKLRPRKLKDLAKEKLGLEIQREGEAHSSVEDAQAAMELYKSVRNKWEKEMTSKYRKVGGVSSL